MSYAVKSYLYLRIAMILVIVMLAVAVAVETGRRCWQGSISAYYYTPAQFIFVGSLITLGVCMVALKGTTEWEDVLLNLGGMLAPVVALVPTSNAGSCNSDALAAAPEKIYNNMIALFAVGVIALIFALIARLVGKSTIPAQKYWPGMAVAIAICVGGILWFALGRTGFTRNAHWIASVSLFLCIVGVVVLNSLRQPESGRRWFWRYLTLSITMVVSAAIMLLIVWKGEWDHGILFVEATLILLFGVFWLFQTVECGDSAGAGAEG